MFYFNYSKEIKMGNRSSQENGQVFQDFYHHPRLGLIKRLQLSQKGQQQIGYTVAVESFRSYIEWKILIQELKNTVCQELLFLPINQSFHKQGFCGNGGKVDLVFKDYMFSLKEEIQNRKKINRFFKETQLWYLLYNLIKPAAYLEKKQERIGDIRPTNILINQDGQINIISQFSWPGNKDLILGSSEQEKQFRFLAPQQIKSRINKPIATYDENKAEIFSIGLTILEAASLIQCQNLYDQKGFNQFKLKQYFDVTQRKYTRAFSSVLQDLLKISAQWRPRAYQILNFLLPYSEKIIKLEQFDIPPHSRIIQNHPIKQQSVLNNPRTMIRFNQNVSISYIRQSKPIPNNQEKSKNPKTWVQIRNRPSIPRNLHRNESQNCFHNMRSISFPEPITFSQKYLQPEMTARTQSQYSNNPEAMRNKMSQSQFFSRNI